MHETMARSFSATLEGAGTPVSSMTAPDPRHAADAALMARIASGDEAAFATLVDRSADRLLAVAERMLDDRAAAEDVVQTALLRAWDQAYRWEPRARIETWLHRVVSRACIDMVRTRRPSASDAVLDTLADPNPGSEARVLAAERDRLVRAGITALPERQRTALVLMTYGEISQRDAAAVLDITEGALESLLVRARRALKATLMPTLGQDQEESSS